MSKTLEIIDLRSDTLTQPTLEMRQAMHEASVGDDVYGEDPTINALQEKIASIFGVEAALFFPSGTMANQAALRLHTQPQDEVICHKHSHVYLYEGGGMAANALLSPKLLEGERGKINADQIRKNINPDDIHYPTSKLVVLENTMNKGGGSVYHLSEITAIADVCNSHGLKLHLDGARIFNALNKTNEDPKSHGALFDTLSVCFSKGLGAPVGSALLGTTADIKRALRIRKSMGGGMRQAGYLAAACIYALDHHVARLEKDHERAQQIGEILQKAPYIAYIYPVETNIVIAKVAAPYTETQVVDFLKTKGILAASFGTGKVRLVTHLGITDDHLYQFSGRLHKKDALPAKPL